MKLAVWKEGSNFGPLECAVVHSRRDKKAWCLKLNIAVICAVTKREK